MILKEMKKAVLLNNWEFSKHAKNRMEKRGYYIDDIKRGILTGEIKKKQMYKQEPAFLIAGDDLDSLPIAIVVTFPKNKKVFVVTVMPPIDKERFDRVI